MALNITPKDDDVSEKDPNNRKDNEEEFVEIVIDEANAYSESREDVIKRFERIARLADEGKLEPPKEVKEFWEKVRKRKNFNAISDQTYNYQAALQEDEHGKNK